VSARLAGACAPNLIFDMFNTEDVEQDLLRDVKETSDVRLFQRLRPSYQIDLHIWKLKRLEQLGQVLRLNTRQRSHAQPLPHPLQLAQTRSLCGTHVRQHIQRSKQGDVDRCSRGHPWKLLQMPCISDGIAQTHCACGNIRHTVDDL